MNIATAKEYIRTATPQQQQTFYRLVREGKIFVSVPNGPINSRAYFGDDGLVRFTEYKD